MAHEKEQEKDIRTTARPTDVPVAAETRAGASQKGGEPGSTRRQDIDAQFERVARKYGEALNDLAK